MQQSASMYVVTALNIRKQTTTRALFKQKTQQQFVAKQTQNCCKDDKTKQQAT